MARSAPPCDPPNLPPKLARFRKKYRDNVIGRWYSGVAHLSFVYIGSCTVIAMAALFVTRPISAGEWTIFFGTFLAANFVEYFGHRIPMHNRMLMGLMFERHTGEHHQFFTESYMTCRSTRDYKIVLFPPVMLIVYLGAVAAPAGAFFYFVYNVNAAMLCVIMSMLYFLQYETLHFCYHLDENAWVARLPVIRQLREHHRIHHAQKLMHSHNFNITWPIADFVFGTIFHGEVEPAQDLNEDEQSKRAA